MKETSPKTNRCNHPRSNLPKSRKLHIKGYPREHYRIDKSEKAQYKTEDSARRAAQWARDRFGEYIEAYHCKYCGCWHIGHRPFLPPEDNVLVLNTIFHNLSSMINRYRDDINQQAQQVIAVSEKLDHLEDTLWEKYHQLKENGFLLNEPKTEESQNPINTTL